MPLTIQTARFGTLELDEAETIEFPLGLIGLGGTRYVFLDRNSGSGFRWLQSLEDPGLALPVVDPRSFFPDFELRLTEDEATRIGGEHERALELYVTVRAAPDPADIVVNLRAPLLVTAGRGYQVLNTAPGAELQAPLFAAAREATASAV